MKTRGKAITSSSILSVLGVLCFATILVAAALISNILTLPGEDVYAHKITLAQGTGAENDWSNADAHYVGDTYTETIVATSNGFTGSYHMIMDFSVDTTTWDTITATQNDDNVPMTPVEGENGIWYSNAVTMSGDDTWVFTFTPATAGTGITVTFEAHEGTYET